MFESLDKVLLAGLGALSMTRERAEKIFDEYVARGQKAKEDRTGFVKEVMDQADKARAELEKLISEQVAKAVGSLSVATKEDIERIERKLDALASRET